MDEKSERTMAMLCHIGALSGCIIPFGNIIVPLVIWFVKREESAFVDDQGKESLNFQISMVIYFIIAAILSLVLIGILIAVILFIAWFILVIMAGLKANEGEKYRYPMTIRLIK